MRSWILTAALLPLLACSSKPTPAPDASAPPPSPTASASAPPTPTPTPTPAAPRTPAVAADHPLYARVEGTGFKNDCGNDADCRVGGCSSEVCSAEDGVNSTCELPVDGFPGKSAPGSACGCVSGACIWYLSDKPRDGTSTTARDACGGTVCAAGLTCVTYYGIAGPRGPELKSCERVCGEGKPLCPQGESCITIADGPGPVCRPDAQAK